MSEVITARYQRQVKREIEKLFAGYNPNVFMSTFARIVKLGQASLRRAYILPGYYMRPTHYAMWKKMMRTPKYKQAFRRPLLDSEANYYGELVYTANNRTNLLLLTIGPTETGKSVLNISLAFYLRDLYIAFSGGKIIPRIYVTFTYGETLEVLKNPEAARKAVMPVMSFVFQPKQFPQFNLSKEYLIDLPDDEIIPKKGDIIIQDEVTKERGEGARSNVEALLNVLHQIRAAQLNFFFATPEQMNNLDVHMFQEPLGRNPYLKSTAVLWYDYMAVPQGLARVTVYPAPPFYIEYENRKMSWVETMITQGGMVGAISKEKATRDYQLILDYISTHKVIPSTKASLKNIARMAGVTGPSSYIDQLVNLIWDMHKDTWDLLSMNNPQTSNEPELSDIAIEDEDEEGIDLLEEMADEISEPKENGSATETPTAELIKEEKTKGEEEKFEPEIFPYDDIALDILMKEKIVSPQNLSWRVVQVAYYAIEILGMTLSQAQLFIKRQLGENVSQKTLSTYRSKKVPYFKQIKTSLITKLGFRYEAWVAENYWKRHPEVAEVHRYSMQDNQSHQGTPDILIVTKEGHKIAVACKVRIKRSEGDFIDNFDKEPEWKAFENGEVDMVILDTFDIIDGRSYRKVVYPDEPEKRKGRINYTIMDSGTAPEHITNLDKLVLKVRALKKEASMRPQ